MACEFSAIVRDAFRARGHDAWSCDLLPTEGDPRFHLRGPVFDFLDNDHRPFELMIAHPPCTHLASSGARWWGDKGDAQREALEFVRHLAQSYLPRICIENPIGKLSTAWRKPDQIIQPWQFGHGETKATCLWLKNLPKLVPTNLVEGREARIHNMSPGPNRWRERSRTFQGVADAMAEQWGDL